LIPAAALLLSAQFLSTLALGQTVDITTLPEAPVRAITRTNGDQVQLGDRIPLNVELRPEWIKGDAQFKLTVPEGSSKLTELGWYLDPSTLWVGGSVRIIVSPLKAGRQTLPTLVIYSKDQDFVAIARTQPVSLNVIAPEKAAQSKAELLDPETIALPGKYIFIGIVGLLALAAAIWYGLKRFKRKSKPVTQMPPVKIDEPEHVIALKRLETLFGNHPHHPDSAKPIAFGVSEILKDFFSKRFKIEAAESTTSEMLGRLRSIGMSTPELREISEFFDDLDEVKFLKQEHVGPYSMERHQRFKVKSMAIVHRWARQIAPVTPAAPAAATPVRETR
jgi:hypothetical protein